MKTIKVRYGESLIQTIEAYSDEVLSATFIVGEEQKDPIITKTALFDNKLEADLSLTPTDTMIPLGKYKYQVNVEYKNGDIAKYPRPIDCNFNDLPDFEVYESLSDTEIS